MKGLSKLLGDKTNRKVWLTFLAISSTLLVITLIIDKSPGLLLCYIGVAALILALVHRWRKAKYFLILCACSIVGFPIFALLHNVMDALQTMTANIIVLSQLFNVLDIFFFLAAIIVCPPGFLIGAIGSIVIYVNNKMTMRTYKEHISS